MLKTDKDNKKNEDEEDYPQEIIKEHRPKKDIETK